MTSSRALRDATSYVGIAFALATTIALALPHARINLLLSVLVPTATVLLLTATTSRDERRAVWRGTGLSRPALRTWPAAVALPVVLCAGAYGAAPAVGAGTLRTDLGSAPYAAELAEVKALGRATGSTRTGEQTYIARWWQSTPVASWNAVARELVARGRLGTEDTARLLALQNLSGADAAITCWNDKYATDFWRPWNAIARAADDGNAATSPDPDWTPLIAAPYPDHPSGHLCLDGAHTGVLRLFFGDRVRGGFSITSSGVSAPDPVTRSFESFSQALDELVEARIWAGLHFRTADVQARRLGEQVAAHTVRHALQPVGHGGPHRR